MKFVFVLFALIGAAFAAPQFGLSGSAANAAASSQTFNQGGFGHGGGFSGSAAQASASSQSFNQGAHYPVHGGGHYPVHGGHGGHYPVHGGGHGGHYPHGVHG